MVDFSLLTQIVSISLLIKTIFLVIEILYGLLTIVIFNQIKTMNDSVHIGDSSSFLLQAASGAQVLFALFLFILTLAIL